MLEDNGVLCTRSASASRKRSYVALAENRDDQDESNKDANTVVIGSRVSKVSIRRSGLLSGIESTEGLASLPRNVAPEDFKLWEAAHIIDVDVPAHEAVIVLKVADALGDRNWHKWVRKVADMAAATDWKHREAADDMLCALAHLPPHLLFQVLTPDPWDRGVRSLSSLLTNFPPPLHHTLVSAAAAKGSLSFSPAVIATVLTHLPHIPLPQPGLHALTICLPDDDSSAPAIRQMPAATGALLANVLGAHPALTRLCLTRPPLAPQWLRSFVACLAPGALPQLLHLRMCADADGGGAAAAASCLRLLPALTSLDITFHLPPQRPKASPSLSLYATAQASLPRLKRMSFIEGDVCEMTDDTNQDSERPTTVDRSTCIATFLPLVYAPTLKVLELEMMASAAPLPTLLSPLARFTALTSLHIQITLQPSVAVQDLDALCRPYPLYSDRDLPALPLSTCQVESVCGVCIVATAAVIAAMARATLTSLTLFGAEPCDDRPYDDDDEDETLKPAWAALFRQAGRCSKLETLTLDCITMISPEVLPAVRQAASQGLAELTGLTSLSLHQQDDKVPRREAVLSGVGFAQALASMSMLESVMFSACGKSHLFDSMWPVLEACGRLERLTSLTLRCVGAAFPHIDAFLRAQRALKELGVIPNDVAQWPWDAQTEHEAIRARYPGISFAVERL